MLGVKKSMECLSDELIANVMLFLPPTDLLQSAPFVSKQFHRITDNDQFWKSTSNHPGDKAFLTRHQAQRSQLFDYYRSIQQEIPSFLSQGNILVPRGTATRLRRGGHRRACVASSTDHLQEQLENCLMEEAEESLALHNSHRSNHHPNGAAVPTAAIPQPWIRWWSSAPALNDQSNDILLFSFRYPLASISDIYIKPLRDPYYENGPVYTWRKTILRVYNIPAEHQPQHGALYSLAPCSFPVVTDDATTLTDGDRRGHRIIHVLGGLLLQNSPVAPSDRPTIEGVLKGQSPVHEQEQYVPRKCNGILSYTLPLGVIGNAIAVELVGKRYEQRTGSGYFACIERVECVGIPLDAVADDDTSMDM